MESHRLPHSRAAEPLFVLAAFRFQLSVDGCGSGSLRLLRPFFH